MTWVGLLAGGSGALIYSLEKSIAASGDNAHPPHQGWSHDGVIASFDHARFEAPKFFLSNFFVIFFFSIRRGYQVYKQVCAACHSMKYIAYRNLVGVSHTEEEAKAEAEESQVFTEKNC